MMRMDWLLPVIQLVLAISYSGATMTILVWTYCLLLHAGVPTYAGCKFYFAGMHRQMGINRC